MPVRPAVSISGEANGQPYIAMEYCDGVTLREWRPQKAVAEIVGVGLQIADALDQAHRSRILDRDLKSDNIVVTSRGQVKILDFGLAKELPAGPEASTMAGLTDVGVVVGTPSYMSPEQAFGRPVDARSDLFSFGVVLYELLTGRLPFEGSTRTEQVDALLHRDPAPIPRYNDQVPDSLTRLVRKMLEKDPERRAQTAREIWNDLGRIHEELAVGRPETPPAVPQPQTSHSPRHRSGQSARVRLVARGSLAVLTMAVTAALAVAVWVSHERTVVPGPAVRRSWLRCDPTRASRRSRRSRAPSSTKSWA